jgi:hypothetical protein
MYLAQTLFACPADLAGALGFQRDSTKDSQAAPPSKTAVNQLQTYLLGASYIKVFSLEEAAQGGKDNESVRLLTAWLAKADVLSLHSAIAHIAVAQPGIWPFDCCHMRRVRYSTHI